MKKNIDALIAKRLTPLVNTCLIEQYGDDEALLEQAQQIVENIIKIRSNIGSLLESDNSNNVNLAKQFHTLKNLLMYAELYYESDICQELEDMSRKVINKNIIKDRYVTLFEILSENH